MSSALVCYLVLVSITAFVIVSWAVSVRAHRGRLAHLSVTVHVNGIRGKSSVTRLVAGVLREGGYRTVAKTTGSAARVISPDGSEDAIFRRGAPTILEQINVVRDYVTPETDALVIECMAVRPLYQEYSQEFIVRSTITVITNVREDHQEEMGETLEEIADSMALTIPRGGLVITAEDRPDLRTRLQQRAEERGSRLVYADPGVVRDADMTGFDYVQFKENVAIGLTVAELCGIPRHLAMIGMRRAVPDVGVVRLRTYSILGKSILWVPLFAANDRESVVLTFAQLRAQFPPGATVIGLLNNRLDRGRRAELFATMVPADLAGYLDEVVTLGAYEESVTELLVAGGWPRQAITNLGDTVHPDLEQLLAGICARIVGDQGVLVGMVNIHTHQAELLLDLFKELDGELTVDELADSRAGGRRPALHSHAAARRARTRAYRATSFRGPPDA